jgi:uncharacterized protein (TIGR03067 family)
MNLEIVLAIVCVLLILAFVSWGVIYTKMTGKPFIVVNPGTVESGLAGSTSEIDGDAVPLETLQGEWRVLEMGKRGRFAPIEELALANMRMRVSGECLTMLGSGETDKLIVNTTNFPTELDQIGADGETTRCIARMIDGQLELCQADPGKPRPLDFSRSRSNENTIVRFVRVENPTPTIG